MSPSEVCRETRSSSERHSHGRTLAGAAVRRNATAKPPTSADLGTWINAYSVTFPVLADPDKKAFAAYVPETVLPAYFLVGRDGVIKFTARGTTDDPAAEARLEAAINQALAEPPAGAQ